MVEKITDEIFQRILDIMKEQKVDGNLKNACSICGDISKYSFLTSYQIAILYNEKYNENNIVGGEGSGIKGNGFANLIATKFSEDYLNAVKNNLKCNYEYVQLSNVVLTDMNYKSNGEVIKSTVLGKNINLYRYKD